MATLNIPNEHRESFEILVTLPPYEIDNLLSALSELPLSVDIDASVKAIASRIKSAAIGNPEGIARTITSLSVTRAHSNTPVEQFVEDILETATESGHKPAANAKENLLRLLSFEPLDIVAKAYHLLHDQYYMTKNGRYLGGSRGF